MARPKKRVRLALSRKPKKRPDLLESLSADDPNFKVGKRFYLEAWADSHGLVADTLAGKVSFSEFVDGCIHTFEQGAQAHVALKTDTPPPAKCSALDDFAKQFISKFKETITSHSKGLGRDRATAAIDRLSRAVTELTSRSKRQILLEARDREFPRQAGGEVEMGGSNFWKERQIEFANHAIQLAPLEACWNVELGVWFLWWGAARNGAVPKEHGKTFNAIARKAVMGLAKSKALDDAEPWQRWLDFMRRSGWGFRVTGNVACTELEWESGVKEGKSLAQVRKELKYTPGDEWEKVYERTETGELRQLSAGELKGKSSEQLQKYYHWLENGTIERVFESSASFCEELASLALEAEIAKGISDGPDGEERWIRAPHGDWRDDADLARNAPPFLEPIAGARLEALAVLYKDAAAAVQKALPETEDQVEACLGPALSQYATSIFDAIAEAELSSIRTGAAGSYETWLRATCVPEVVRDVCRPIIGQFQITLRQVIESLGSSQSPKIDGTRRALWRMTTEVLGGPFTENLIKRLTVDLEVRSVQWESKAVSTRRSIKRTTDSAARGGRPGALKINGDKVLELRGNWNWSQPRFGRSTGLSVDVIQRAEQGEATDRTIKKLLKFAKSKSIPLTAEDLKKTDR
jgi:hypothetical protein